MNIVTNLKQLNIPTEPVKSVKEGEMIAATLLQYLTQRTTGIGISANQLGINKRVAVVNVTDPIYLINPEIIERGNEVDFKEGCLSIKRKKPVNTKRYDRIVVKCDNYESNMVFEADHEDDTAGLLECMCVQHEIDHLDGKTILDRKFIPPNITSNKIGRNQKVTISNGSETKIVKYKKAIALIDNGWVLDDIPA